MISLSGGNGVFGNSFPGYMRMSTPAVEKAADNSAVAETKDKGAAYLDLPESLLNSLNLGKSGNGKSSSADSGMSDLLKDMGLDDIELSPDQSYSLQYSKFQFELNYQTISSLNSANGSSTKQTSFSLSASFELMQVSSGGNAVNPFAQTENGAAVDPMEALKEMFSPENTAKRILDFALSFFPGSSQYAEGGDNEDSRQNFADYIGAAIQKGFDQAMGILGTVPEETQDGIDQTHEIVFGGLDDFVKNGLDKNKEKEGVYESIQAYRMEISLQMEYTSVSSYSNYGYDSSGKAVSSGNSGKIDTAA